MKYAKQIKFTDSDDVMLGQYDNFLAANQRFKFLLTKYSDVYYDIDYGDETLQGSIDCEPRSFWQENGSGDYPFTWHLKTFWGNVAKATVSAIAPAELIAKGKHVIADLQLEHMVQEETTKQTIDLTPSWEAHLRTLIILVQDGNGAGKKAAIEELVKMAKLADHAAKFYPKVSEQPRKLRIEEAKEIVDNYINYAYQYAHEMCGTINGDETPFQHLTRQELQEQLAAGMVTQVNQNLPESALNNYVETPCFIGKMRMKYVVITFNKEAGVFQLWANEYFETATEAVEFIEQNNFELCSDCIVEWKRDEGSTSQTILPLIPHWTVIPANDVQTLQSYDVDMLDADESNKIVYVLLSSKKYWIRLHENGKFSTIVMRESAYGSFKECVELIETEMGEQVN